jgi:hypothetical protein
VVNTSIQIKFFPTKQIPFAQFFLGFAFVLLACFSIFAQTDLSQPDENTLIVNDAPEMEVFSLGKTVIVKKEAKGVLAFGGDVIIEGKISGDVAAIGGSIIQKKDAFIGGDVIIFGGTYRPESQNPLRNNGKETIMYAGYEKELRDLSQNPTQLFSPTFSWSFLAQRLLSILFWFIISMALTTIAPGAIGRSVAKFQLSALKTIGIGLAGFILTTITITLCLSLMPNYISAIISLMIFVMLLLAYVFGRVALQVSLGKKIQKHFLPENKQSETFAILTGVLVWTTFLSLPYVWIFGLFILLSASIGLVLTARSTNGWKKA